MLSRSGYTCDAYTSIFAESVFRGWGAEAGLFYRKLRQWMLARRVRQLRSHTVTHTG